jgi:hypothetical protein
MLWDCEACGSKKLLGKDHRHCPNCGQVQDENRRYLPDQREAVPTTYSPSPDNECDHCGTPNSYKANNCVNCGAPMKGTKAVHKRAPTSSMAAETVEDAARALEARQEAARAKAEAFHQPEAQAARERERAQEAERHKERERRRKADYDRRRKEAEERNRRQGDLWKEREGFADPEPEIPSSKLQTFWDQHKLHFAIGAGLLVLIGALWLIFFWEKTVEVEVESRYWERSQVIEQFKASPADGWCDEKPHDAYNVSWSSKVHHHKTVTDCTNCDCHDEEYKSGESCHESCSTSREPDGAGGYDVVETCHDVCTPEYSTRQVCHDRTHEEPVYEDYCNYQLNRWRPQRTAQESGGVSIEPVWPELVYDQCAGSEVLGCERPGVRNAVYQVNFRDLHEPEKYECEWDQAKWSGYDVGSRHEAIVKVFGGRFQCESLTRSSF